MIQVQLKLKLTPRQERKLDRWLYHLTSVWNWGIKKIERDAELGSYHTKFEFSDILTRHGAKIDVPQDAIRGTLWTAHNAWKKCFKKESRKPRFKGRRNRLNTVSFSYGTTISKNRISIPKLGKVSFHQQATSEQHISQMRLVKRASGWYACLFIKTEPNPVPRKARGVVGIDPGFESLATLSNGEKIKHHRELEQSQLRLSQAQRGRNKRLTSRLHERIRNRRKDRNHKLSRRLVSENVFIAFSKDHTLGVAKLFGKSVTSSGHGQLRSMLSYKSSRTGDTTYVEPESKNSTMRCSVCKALTGPTGLSGLAVRQWVCTNCGSSHDRDVNAAINTLIAGVGMTLEFPKSPIMQDGEVHFSYRSALCGPILLEKRAL